jgi:hypothetical protein
MKLYEVEISVTTVVQADSYLDAHQVASRNKHEIMDDLGVGDITVLREITNVAHLPDGWKDWFCPYGEPERPIKFILEEQK